MKISDADVAFWLFHKAPAFVPRRKAPSIHEVINGHSDKVKRSNVHHASSLCSLLQSSRRHYTFGQTDRESLYYFAHLTLHPPEERKRYAKRWYRRLCKVTR